ncbi:transposase [Alkaliphilus crotonatoxidans]
MIALPRSARIKDEYGIYYITQRGSSNRKLFENEGDRDKFLTILMESKEKNGFKLYGYCIAKDNEYHLIINANGSDISKIMKGINISYAMYVDNSTGNLYRDRYKSLLIQDKFTLMEILSKIHAVGRQNNNKYNSYCIYHKEPLFDSQLIDQEDLTLLEDEENCLYRKDNCRCCLKTPWEAKNKLLQIAESRGITLKELMKDKDYRNQLIRDFRKNSILSLKELGEVFGGLSESSICKILNNK